MNFDDPDGNNIENEEQQQSKPAAKKRNKALYCPFCGIKGHATKRSGKCIVAPDAKKLYGQEDGLLLQGAFAPTHDVMDPVNDDADDMDQYDTMPFDSVPADDDNDDVDNVMVKKKLHILHLARLVCSHTPQ
jgi:hypothetical protein